MLLQFTSQILVVMGLVRLIAAALEALIFARWHLKPTGKKMALYYWMLFHTVAAWMSVLVLFRFFPGLPFATASSYVTFVLLIFALMFVVPPYRSKIGLGYRMLGEMEENKPQQSTQRFIELMQMRVYAAYGGIGALVALFLFRLFVKTTDIFVLFINDLNKTAGWLYYSGAGIAALFCCISAFFAVQILYAGNKQRAFRRKMHAKLGRRPTDEEFMYAFAEEQKNNARQ